MLQFDPKDPYPLVHPRSHTYAEAQLHSEAVDAWLGFRIAPIENALRGHVRTWIGLPTRSLLTPYTEIRWILSELDPSDGSRLVDLGAGYGRWAFVLSRHYPGVEFLGYELEIERVLEARRCFALHGLRARMEQADLSASGFKPEIADHYFLYDYGSREAIEKTLHDLREIARSRPVAVIGRGRASRDAIELRHPWLSQVHEPRHFAHFSIYRS